MTTGRPWTTDEWPFAIRRCVGCAAWSVPAWWRDAKLGIFVHWTPASVPGVRARRRARSATLLQSGRRDALGWSPYTEWYENSLRFPDSPVARHHRDVYGDRPYADFAAEWEAGLEQWDPDAWAATFAATGARYVVLVTKHHDGYCLWPTDVANPHRPGWHCARDVVGELGEAVRGRGDALRRLLLGRSRLDVRRPADRLARRHARRDPARRLSRPTPRRRCAS